ncbi:unnamed protein product [Auanema sp. JU1783]|nr:unnamed protein product [Auanema sp. JU1783]
MTCDCLAAPPSFSAIPPPDPSLIWHLLSEEEFEKAPDCEWSPFVSISNIGKHEFPLTSRALIATAVITCLFLLTLLVTLIYRISKRRKTPKSKTSSSLDAIISYGADNAFTYNSMKTSPTGGLIMYNGTSNRMFSNATPATVRSYIGSIVDGTALRHSASTTLRLHPSESTAYHTVVGQSRNGPPTEYYEEIPPRGTLPTHFHVPPPPVTPPLNQHGRMSMRKPPPSCRPPPPPQEYSPGGSDISIERELTRLPQDSPPCRRWEEEGRESGYGTAPSRQWRSPPGSGGRPDDSRCPGFLLPHTPQNSHSMTYV